MIERRKPSEVRVGKAAKVGVAEAEAESAECERARLLLSWYFENARDLPWRESHDPYRIWLSEVMLQQTQVVTVVGYFTRFLERFPTVMDLAAADEDEVFKLWEGLGYYSRARRLIPCARVVVERHGGVFPDSLEALLKLPGIGPYTAGAVLSIAYNKRVPAIDGNVLRVASRWYALDTDIRLPAAHKEIESRLLAEMPEDARHYNQALMELGACVCTPRSPGCGACPVAGACEALARGLTAVLPYKSKAKEKVASDQLVAYVTCGDLVLIEKRPPDALLGSLWGFPVFEVSSGADGEGDLAKAMGLAAAQLEADYGLRVAQGEADWASAVLSEATHVFTHRIWRMKLVGVEAQAPITTDLPETRWVKASELKAYALPTAFRKLLRDGV